MRDELFYDEVLALCRARRELGMAQQALDVLKAKYARAKKAERHAHRALVDASLKWVAQGNNPARLPRGIGFSRRERMDYDADEMLAQAMARGALRLLPRGFAAGAVRLPREDQPLPDNFTDVGTRPNRDDRPLKEGNIVTLKPLDTTLPWNDEIRDYYLSDEFAGDSQKRRDQWLEGLQVAVTQTSIYALTNEQARLVARYAADHESAHNGCSMDDLNGYRYDLVGLVAMFTTAPHDLVDTWIQAADRATCTGYHVETC